MRLNIRNGWIFKMSRKNLNNRCATKEERINFYSLSKLLHKHAIKKQIQTYIPAPAIGWMSLEDVNSKEIHFVVIVMNNFGEVVQKVNEKWGSATAAKIQNQWARAFSEIQ